MFRVQHYKMFLFSPHKQYERADVVLHVLSEATLVTPKDWEDLKRRDVLSMCFWDFYFGVLMCRHKAAPRFCACDSAEERFGIL